LFFTKESFDGKDGNRCKFMPYRSNFFLIDRQRRALHHRQSVRRNVDRNEDFTVNIAVRGNIGT
jgi:hypothetical protein